MNRDRLRRIWKKEENKVFKGWDFSYLDSRWYDEKLPWNYKKILKEYLKSEYKILDMGTGGGEFLLSLNHPYNKTSVTEMWELNIKVCKEKLAPLGIGVYQIYQDKILPFKDNSFDMIINRHESYDVKEIKRILRPRGIFITQQVGGRNNEILSNRLIKDFNPQFKNISLDNAIYELKENFFNIIYKNEYFPYLHFYDVGSIVYFAKIIEWEFPNFSVDSCFNELYDLYKELKQKSYVESFEHRFIIVCKNIK
ncbi:methyltransferase, SAM-dependent [Gottschalkia acidurici 9a]|uniref:Methyltransferase, SAM-dependent n=1 Tax=Gottschalkia acidurici (strain ATCC 7906 / DSM 604 / BCRC 14475 / CIP 104303 / KCTC 5404 / NCIMB 10678 / 9a) TaxID=1128398 RepID=K0B1B6_GOTA9|nr:class I SAM-dependent methyltransferase [Gottschalkia acidurici]AFS78436.1 methyltransferase, SAM-dependent [Gottschalkia acidurici 9a]